MKLTDVSYFKFRVLSADVQRRNNIDCQSRYDLDLVYNPKEYKGFEYFKTKKGQIYVNAGLPSFVKADSRRCSKIVLTAKSLNLSSLFIYEQGKGFAYQNPNVLLRDKSLNPQIDFAKDLYLVLENKEKKTYELFVFPWKRNLAEQYLQKFLNGDFDSLFESLRNQAKPFFDY